MCEINELLRNGLTIEETHLSMKLKAFICNIQHVHI